MEEETIQKTVEQKRKENIYLVRWEDYPIKETIEIVIYNWMQSKVTDHSRYCYYRIRAKAIKTNVNVGILKGETYDMEISYKNGGQKIDRFVQVKQLENKAIYLKFTRVSDRTNRIEAIREATFEERTLQPNI